MKIAIISDIHGNYDALSALPEDYDELWVLGDLLNYGPQPREVIEFVRARAALVVRGNHDNAVGFGADPRCSPPYRDMAEATARFSDEVLTAREKAYLRSLPLFERRIIGGKRVYACHAVPSDPLFGYCPPDSKRWPAETASTWADVLLTGHTHVPVVRTFGGTLLVNPGSLGQPKNGTRACYAVLQDGQIELKSFSYPFNETIAKIRTLPIAPEIREDLVHVLNSGGEWRRAPAF